MNFIEYYNDNTLDEGLFSLSKSPILKMLGAGLRTAYKAIKPKTFKIKTLGGLVDPQSVVQITKPTSDNLLGVISSDLALWKEESKDKGFVDKFVLKSKTPFIKDIYVGQFDPSLKLEIKKMFKLSNKWIIGSVNLFKTTNGGNILMIEIVDPYDGQVQGIQVNPKTPRQIEKELSEAKYYIALDKRAERWFVEKKNMPYRNYISLLKTYTPDQLTREIKAAVEKYKGKEEKTKETTTKRKDKYSWKITLDEPQYETYVSKAGIKKRLEDKGNFDKFEKITPTTIIKDGVKFLTKTGIPISLVKINKKDGEGYSLLTTEDGKNLLVDYLLADESEFKKL